MRYQCRIAGKPATYDVKYPGTDNARRDNLEGFWKSLFGSSHGLMVVSSFFENELLSPWVKPEDATLVRYAVYKFRSLIAVLVRPDYYVFGAVSQLSELPALVHDLASRLCISALSAETQ